MAALCATYREKRFVRATFEPGECIRQGAQYAIADIHWRIEWANGEDPWRFSTTYNLTRTEEGWRVLLCTAYAEDRHFAKGSAA